MKVEFAIHTSRSVDGVLWFAARVCLGRQRDFIAWKDKIEVVLEDNGLKKFVDQEIPKPIISDAQNFAKWKKCVAKARQIILEGVRDHIVSPWQGNSVCYVENIDGLVLEHQ